MTTDAITISMSEIKAFEDKLKDLREQLSPNEQAALDWLLERAAATPASESEEVQGYVHGGLAAGSYSPYTSLSMALGLSGQQSGIVTPQQSLARRGIIVVGG